MNTIRLNPLDASWVISESRAAPNHVGGLLQFRLRSFPSNLTAMVFGYRKKPTFTVENEQAISNPLGVDFDSAPAKPQGSASGEPR